MTTSCSALVLLLLAVVLSKFDVEGGGGWRSWPFIQQAGVLLFQCRE